MILFRVELKHTRDVKYSCIGCGMYQEDLPVEAKELRLSTILNHNTWGREHQPMPYEDRALQPNLYNTPWIELPHIRFAFASIEQYKSWFPSSIGRELATTWGVLVQYDVPDKDVLIGCTQCLVVASSMVKVGTLPLNIEDS